MQNPSEKHRVDAETFRKAYQEEMRKQTQSQATVIELRKQIDQIMLARRQDRREYSNAILELRDYALQMAKVYVPENEYKSIVETINAHVPTVLANKPEPT